MLIQNVGLCCNITHIFLKKFNILIEGKERTAKTKLFPAECAVWMCDTARSLRKNEFFIKTILDSLSGTQMGSIPEKLNCKKSRDTASLSPPMPCTSKIFMFSYRLISEEGTLFGVYSNSNSPKMLGSGAARQVASRALQSFSTAKNLHVSWGSLSLPAVLLGWRCPPSSWGPWRWPGRWSGTPRQGPCPSLKLLITNF